MMSTMKFHHRDHGFTLIELMIGMLLGLIVIAGVSSVFLANLRSYHTTTALGEVQSNARVAFELMSRDIRQAGLSGCNYNLVPAEPPVDPKTGVRPWWGNWNRSLNGFDENQTDSAVTTGDTSGQRVASTDSLEVRGTTGLGAAIDPAHAFPQENGAASTFSLIGSTQNLAVGDLAMACDLQNAAIFKITAVNGVAITHEGANGGTPTYGFVIGGKRNGKVVPAYVFRYTATDWYIGNNPVGGTSLYRVTHGKANPEELVRGVSNMQITYHVAGDDSYKSASNIAWNNASVTAVRVELTMQSSDKRAGTDAQPLSRTFTSITTLRSQVNPYVSN